MRHPRNLFLDLTPFLFIVVGTLGALGLLPPIWDGNVSIIQGSQPSILTDTCPTGKEGNVWFLGEVGLDFNSGRPLPIHGFAAPARETQTSICEENGDLLMYFDGDNLYDASHSIMSGGNDLNSGGRSTTQSIFIKQPGNDSIYYLFFTEAVRLVEPLSIDTTKKLWFCVIDINSNNGLGTVIRKKKNLLQPSTEKVTAIPHCNGEDFWILGSEAGSNRFFTWLLNKDSLHYKMPIISSSGQGNSGIGATKAGYLKPSHDGHLLCEVTGIVVNMHRFDANTGVVSDGYELINRSDQMAVYGCEFSPNNSKLYLTGYYIWQLNLWAGNLQEIRNSLYQVLINPKSNVGAPTLGPDNIIYITKFDSRESTLFTINKPNIAETGCDYREYGFELQSSTGLGAPNFPAGYLFPDRLYPRYPDTAICMDSLAPIWITGPCDHHNPTWQLLDGGELQVIDPDSVSVNFNEPGTFRIAVSAESRCGMRYDTITIKVKDCSCSNFAGTLKDIRDTLTICEFDTAIVSHDQSYRIGPTDSLIFVLHDRRDDTLGTLLAEYSDSSCYFVPGLQFNRPYYFSAVVASRVGSQLDLDDPCISVSRGRPVIFRERPAFTIIGVPPSKCQDSCVMINLQISGIGPFSFWVRNAHYDSLGKFHPIESLTNQSNVVSFEWCQDTLDLSHIKGAYCYENLWDTTIVIRSIPEPYLSSLSIDSKVCQGEYSRLELETVNAQRIEVINQETGTIRVYQSTPFDIGPIMNDSCYTLRMQNEAGCEIDTVFCIEYLLSYSGITDTFKLCESDSIISPTGQYITDSGEYPFILQTEFGCDSQVLWYVLVEESKVIDVEHGDETCHGAGDGWIYIVDDGSHEAHLNGVLYKTGDTIFDLNSGTYRIEHLNHNSSCTSDTIIEIHAGNRLDIFLPNEIKALSGGVELPLEILAGDPNSYSWWPDLSMSCNDCQRPIVYPDTTTYYSVIAKSEAGCVDEAGILVVVKKSLYLPTSFTPNGDGLNDTYRPYFSQNDRIYRMNIWNRWGELVYSCEGSNCAWDGTFDGQPLNPGVFICEIISISPDDEIRQIQSVTLLK